jgi:DNA-binding PadR family transcriptional regulator
MRSPPSICLRTEAVKSSAPVGGVCSAGAAFGNQCVLVRSAKAEQTPKKPAESLGNQRLLNAGQSYLERLGILYMEQIRATIVTELYMREMGVQQFYDTIGGSSYDSVRRHFLKLVEHGWLRKVRTVATGRGRPEALYRATEQAVIDTETWRTIPFSIRDALTVQLLLEMGARLGEALGHGTADARADGVATFRTIEVDQLAWCRAYDAIEHCFQTLLQEQTDAKIRMENSGEQPLLMVVNLAAFEASPPREEATSSSPLPKANEKSPPPPWPQRIGKVFADRLDLAIVDELNNATMTPAQLHATLGGTSSQGFLRRCKRLADLGWTVNIDTQTGGSLHGANVYHFRAAAPNVSESDIIENIPAALRKGQSWDAFQSFIATSIEAVDVGTFNNRFDRHLTMSPLLVDETGWEQVIKALRTFEETVLRLENELAERRRSEKVRGFPAAFLISSFQSPLRRTRH